MNNKLEKIRAEIKETQKIISDFKVTLKKLEIEEFKIMANLIKKPLTV